MAELQGGNVNFPGDKIHHITIGFGRLVIPVGRKRWLIFAFGMKDVETGRTLVKRGLIVESNQFHNCRGAGQ